MELLAGNRHAEEETMTSVHSPQRTSKGRNEPERRIEETGELLRGTVERLSRHCPPDMLRASARDGLRDLRPHLEEALASLEVIEEHRSLTDEELSQRRAFNIALAAALHL